MSEKTRYADDELQEFKELIQDKLLKAREDYKLYKNAQNSYSSARKTRSEKYLALFVQKLGSGTGGLLL